MTTVVFGTLGYSSIHQSCPIPQVHADLGLMECNSANPSFDGRIPVQDSQSRALLA
jgi:hypothetical protein